MPSKCSDILHHIFTPWRKKRREYIIFAITALLQLNFSIIILQYGISISFPKFLIDFFGTIENGTSKIWLILFNIFADIFKGKTNSVRGCSIRGQMKHVTWSYRQKCESLEVFSALLTLILSKTWWLFHTWEQKRKQAWNMFCLILQKHFIFICISDFLKIHSFQK